MTSENDIARIRKGMEVQTTDGKTLGKVAAVWLGTDPSASSPRCDEDLCSRVEVHHGFVSRSVLYVPYSAIAGVAGDFVMLSVDAATVHEHDWSRMPGWVTG